MHNCDSGGAQLYPDQNGYAGCRPLPAIGSQLEIFRVMNGFVAREPRYRQEAYHAPTWVFPDSESLGKWLASIDKRDRALAAQRKP